MINRISPKDNMIKVLTSAYEDYSQVNESHDFIGIALSNLESGDMSFINESINASIFESESLNEMAINVNNPHIVKERHGEGISVTVNGKEYRYVSPNRSTEDLFRSFMGMYKHANAGYLALNYLKKNALCYYGAKDSKGKDLVESDNKTPDKCTCGGDIGIFLCGEPVYKCKKCNKYYGAVPFNEDTVVDISKPSHTSVADGTTGPNLSNPKMKSIVNETGWTKEVDQKYYDLRDKVKELIKKDYNKFERGTRERDEFERINRSFKAYCKRHGFTTNLEETTQPSAIPPSTTEVGIIGHPPKRFTLGEMMSVEGEDDSSRIKSEPLIAEHPNTSSYSVQSGYEITESVINISTTGMPYYDDFLDDKKSEYKKEVKGLVAEVVVMTPDEYIDRLASDIFHCSLDRVFKGVNNDLVSKYSVQMSQGSKFDLPILDVANGTQEGRHRALAARKLGLEEIPVLVVTKSIKGGK